MNKVISGKTILLNTKLNTTFVANKFDEEVQNGTRESDHIEWAGELNVPVKDCAKLMRELFQEIKHGDQEHQDWLEEK